MPLEAFEGDRRDRIRHGDESEVMDRRHLRAAEGHLITVEKEVGCEDMETVAKICETIYNASGEIFEPIELTNARFSSNMSDCPLLHVGKDISLNAKSRFCDLICTTGSKAVFNTVMEPQQGSCTWDKALIKGAGKCTVVFELGNTA